MFIFVSQYMKLMGGLFNICREIGGRIYFGEINEKVVVQKQYDVVKKKG